MSFQWARYLDLARELAGKPVTVEGQEAKLRSSISRAYYAAFHKAREHLLTVDRFPSQNLNEHEYVKNWFLQRQTPLTQRIGADLDRLRLDRNWADYRDEWRGGIGSLRKTTEQALIMAERIIQNLQRL